MTGMRLTKIVVAAVVGLLLAIVLAQVGCQPERRSRGVASDAELRSIWIECREALDRVFKSGKVDHSTVMFLEKTIWSEDLSARGYALPVLQAIAEQSPEMAAFATKLVITGLSRCESDAERASWLHGLEQVLVSAGMFEGEPTDGAQILRELGDR